MTPEDLTDDAKVILLLCGHFGKNAQPADGYPPLGTGDYARFSSFLQGKGLRPASLLEQEVLAELEAGMCPVPIPRIRSLLARGAAMGFAVESWMNKGLWVLCRSDPAYPRRLKQQLREMAPPFLYGAGDPSLLDRGGLAIVGSRKIGPEEERFVSQVANRCARDGMQVVSGGARGVDQTAMREALDAGGTVAGVLADGLLKKSLQKFHRDAIHDRRLVLVSTTHPEAGFNVGAAMARNKLIYALADHALVVKAEFKKGGTWSGAVEELKRPGGRTVFIREKFNPENAVEALRSLGAMPFPELAGDSPLPLILKKAGAPPAKPIQWAADELPLVKDSPDPTEQQTTIPHSAEGTSKSDPIPPATIFDAVWPLLRSRLSKPIKPADLAESLGVRKAQADDWLDLARQKHLVRKLSKPVRYVLDDCPELDLKPSPPSPTE